MLAKCEKKYDSSVLWWWEYCDSQFFVTMTEMPDKYDLEEEKFIVVHGFRGSVHGWLTPFHHDVLLR